MSKLFSALVAAGFALSLGAAVAQNVDSDKDKAQGQEKIMRDKERGTGADQSQPGQMRSRHYTQMRERCSTLTADQREQCLANARSQYLTSATARCGRLTDASMKQSCFNDVQGAVGLPTTGEVTGSTDATSAGTQGNQSDTVKKGGDEDKPGRQ